MNNSGNKKFIYVFNQKDADLLLSNGYALLKEDAKHNMFIFLNPNKDQEHGAQKFSLDAIDPKMVYCLTDTLMF